MTADQEKNIEKPEVATPTEAVKTPEPMGFRSVFPEGKSEATRSLENNLSSVNVKLDTLRKLQKEDPDPVRQKERQEQIAKLERQWGRISRYSYLQLRGTSDQKKIVDKKDSFEQLRASDILSLKKNGVDLANLLLVPENNPTGSVSRDAIKEKDSFIVNFGENASINAITGAGDILPPTVSQVKITSAKYPNGIVAERRNSQRPGYYNDTCKPPYIAIYDGDKIEITKIGPLSKEDLDASNKADEEQLNRISEEEAREEAVRKLSLEEKKNFMDSATTIAKAIETQYGIPWQVTVGQAALESGYGKSGLAQAGNFFGIKWAGKVFATREVYDGKEVMENASFRTYSDMKESFIDYARFLTKNPRYREAFQYAQDINPRPSYYPKDYVATNFSPQKFIEAIWGAGYATDPKYVDKVAGVWNTNQIEVA